MSISSSSAQQALATLGARLRELRQDAGLTGRDLAHLAGWHSSKVSKIEHGRQTPMVSDIMTWCAHCKADDQTPELIAAMRAVEGMYIEWRRINHSGLLHTQQRLRPLWERTSQFRIYESFLIPGVIQTPDYARAVLRSLQQRLELPDDVEATAQDRVERQRVLRQPERRFAILIEEGVLRSRVGGREVMAAQLGHLLTAASLPSISLGVIPLNLDRAAWATESFWIFDRTQVSIELVSGDLTITQAHEIATYERRFDELNAHAVYGAQARKLIADAIVATADGVE